MPQVSCLSRKLYFGLYSWLAKGASHVITQTNKTDWWKIWSFLLARKLVLPKHFLKRKFFPQFLSFLSEHSLRAGSSSPLLPLLLSVATRRACLQPAQHDHVVWLFRGSSNLHITFDFAGFVIFLSNVKHCCTIRALLPYLGISKVTGELKLENKTQFVEISACSSNFKVILFIPKNTKHYNCLSCVEPPGFTARLTLWNPCSG